MCLCQATCDRPGYTGGVISFEMETWGRLDARRRARGESEPGCRSYEAVEFADANELRGLRRRQLRRDRRAVAERAKPVTEHTVFGGGRLRRGCETRVVIGVLVYCRRRIFVAVVGRVPASQRARQDEDDRECDKRLRAKSQRAYQAIRPAGYQAISVRRWQRRGSGRIRSARRGAALRRSSRNST